MIGIPGLSLKVGGIAFLLGAAAASPLAWKFGGSHWQIEYQKEHSDFADFKAKRAEGQLSSFETELAAHQAKEATLEASLQATVAGARRSSAEFHSKLEEARRADPALNACLRMPIPDSLRNASPAEVRPAADSDLIF